MSVRLRFFFFLHQLINVNVWVEIFLLIAKYILFFGNICIDNHKSEIMMWCVVFFSNRTGVYIIKAKPNVEYHAFNILILNKNHPPPVYNYIVEELIYISIKHCKQTVINKLSYIMKCTNYNFRK